LFIEFFEYLVKIIDFKITADDEEWKPFVQKYRKQWTYHNGKVIRLQQVITEDDEDYVYSLTPAQDYLRAKADAENAPKPEKFYGVTDGGFTFKANNDISESTMNETKDIEERKK